MPLLPARKITPHLASILNTTDYSLHSAPRRAANKFRATGIPGKIKRAPRSILVLGSRKLRAIIGDSHPSEGLPPDFNATEYLGLNPDLIGAISDPELHYRNHGIHEGRRYSILHKDFGRALTPGRRTILIVNHDASKTGAPILGMNLIQEYRDRGFNVIAMFLGDGDIKDVVDGRDGIEVVFDPDYKTNSPLSANAVRSICHKTEIDFAIVNSIESRSALRPLAEYHIPSLALIHEFASYTRPSHAIPEAFMWAAHVVFSSPLTRTNSIESTPWALPYEPKVLPQGRCVLPPSHPEDSDDGDGVWQLRQLMRPDGSPDNLVVVLGMGTVHLRKGVDLFIQLASTVVKSAPELQIRFVWIGAAYDVDEDIHYSVYLDDQIKRSGLQDHLFIGSETPHLDVAYELADLFVVSSRLDPLPNVAIDSLLEAIPVLCYDNATGIAPFLKSIGLGDACVGAYLDAPDLGSKLIELASSPSKRKLVGEQSQEAAARTFDMDRYVDQLTETAQEASDQFKQEEADARTIRESGLVRYDFLWPPNTDLQTPEALIRWYVRSWATRQATRKPMPGFHPEIFADHHSTSTPMADPFAEYIRAGQPRGPWSTSVIEASETLPPLADPGGGASALHIHVFYPDLLESVLEHLASNRSKPDLYISCGQSTDLAAIESLLDRYDGRTSAVTSVPNRGRDLGPLLTDFGTKLIDNYEFVGHIHTKKTVDVADPDVGHRWFMFLLKNLLGDSGSPMLDQILAKFNSDPAIGMVFPDDPNAIGWSENREIAEDLAQRLNIGPLCDSFNFPVGSMFWARSSAIKPLVDMGWTLDDFPPEPLPYDGTILHAVERILPFVAESQGFRVAVSNTHGLTR